MSRTRPLLFWMIDWVLSWSHTSTAALVGAGLRRRGSEEVVTQMQSARGRSSLQLALTLPVLLGPS
jgi:uncharacterized membrane protein